MLRAFVVVAMWTWGAALFAGAQAPRMHASSHAAPPASAPVQVQLGKSAVDLFGPWHFHTGDDPAWSQPGFDDAGWEAVSLRSPGDGPDLDPGTSGYVPGWTAMLHPKYAGYAWYRLRVDVEGAKRRLSLKMPDAFDDAYQVFVNGQQVGNFGRFSSTGVLAYSSQPRAFRLPADVRDGPLEIAIRVWMDSSTRYSVPDAGGLHGPPMLGLSPEIASQVRLDWDDVAHGIGSGFLETLVLFLALVVAFTHFWLDREESAYFWLGLVCFATLLSNLILLLINFTTSIPLTLGNNTRDVVLSPLRIGLWVMFWASWFHLGLRRWLGRAVWPLAAALGVGTLLLRPPLYGQVVPLSAAGFLVPALLWLKLGLAAVLVWVTYRGIHQNRAEGLLALPAILLAIVANYQHELRLIHVPILYDVFHFNISLGQISTMLSLLLVTLMASRRFLLSQRRKVQWRLEVEQASELQQVIIPSSMPCLNGLTIESEYRPSREVGGDFYQVLPDAGDGSVLVVVGDVTGKGLRAGMLVALIVGAVDTAAKDNPHPARLLGVLNDQLYQRGFATATCLVIKIYADGTLSAANAGHLPPYLNGRELEMEGALPLGTLPGMEYATLQHELQPGDSLMLMTDGVVEAQNEHGALFGFERIDTLLASHASAHEIAEAAQRFGQEDDILVLRLQRTVPRVLNTAGA